jgi:ketosteroid isomerase-like protein
VDVGHAWFGFIDASDLDGLRSLYAADAHAYFASQQQRTEGADAIVDATRQWTQAFPDLRGTLNGVHVDGATVTVEATFAGTWSGPLRVLGRRLKPTNRPMTVRVCEVMEIKDGRILAARGYYDMLTILQQIGAMENAGASA